MVVGEQAVTLFVRPMRESGNGCSKRAVIFSASGDKARHDVRCAGAPGGLAFRVHWKVQGKSSFARDFSPRRRVKGRPRRQTPIRFFVDISLLPGLRCYIGTLCFRR